VVVACYVALYIVHARVTDFDIVPIKDLVEWVFGWKILVDELKESLSDFFSDCFAERGVEPDDMARNPIQYGGKACVQSAN
jgi:hypothetical protein